MQMTLKEIGAGVVITAAAYHLAKNAIHWLQNPAELDISKVTPDYFQVKSEARLAAILQQVCPPLGIAALHEAAMISLGKRERRGLGILTDQKETLPDFVVLKPLQGIPIEESAPFCFLEAKSYTEDEDQRLIGTHGVPPNCEYQVLNANAMAAIENASSIPEKATLLFGKLAPLFLYQQTRL